MNMKKLMAGIAASALAVTSLATAASAENFAEFAKFSGKADSPLDKYDVIVDLKGSVVGMTDKGVLTLNVATGEVTTAADGVVTSVKNPYYYAKNNDNYGVVIRSDILLVFRYRGVDIEIAGKTAADNKTTEWIVDTNSGLTADSTVNKVLEYVNNPKNAGHIPANNAGFSLDIARLHFHVELYSTVEKSATDKEKVFYKKLTDDLRSVVRTTDITNYGVSDSLQLNLGGVAGKPDVAIKVDNVVSQEDVDYSLAVKRGEYTVTPLYAPQSVTAGNEFRFYTEDVGSFDEGVNAAGRPTARRLNATQQTEVRNLKEDAEMTVTVTFYGKVNADNVGFGVQTDLMRWRGEDATWIPIAKGESSKTFTLPVKDFYDSAYRVGYSSGFLGKLNILYLDGSKFDTPDGHNANILEVLIQYDRDDIDTDSSKEETPGGTDDTTPAEKPVTSTAIDGATKVYVTALPSVINANAGEQGSRLDVVFTKAADGSTANADIKLYDLATNNPIQPGGEVTVRLYFPANAVPPAGLTSITHTHNGVASEAVLLNPTTYLTDGYFMYTTDKFSGWSWPVDANASEPDETEASETEAPETEAPETEAPETEAPETEAPETQAPETDAPATEAPAPETQAPAADNGNTNPGTGVVIAVIPALVAAAGVVIAKKRK